MMRSTFLAHRVFLGKSVAGLVDQIVYTTTNLLMTLAVARFETIAEFGRFSLLYLIAVNALSVLRARYGQPLLFDRSQEVDRRALRVAGLAILAGAIVLLSGRLIGASSTIVLAAAVPAVAFQDFLRHSALGQRRLWHVLRLDLVWMVVQVVSLGVGALAIGPRVEVAIGSWGIGAVGSVLAGWRHVRLSRAPETDNPCIQMADPSIARWLTIDVFAGSVKHQSLVLLFALFAGWKGAGAFRLCVTVLGFVPILYTAMVGVIVPEGTGPHGRRSLLDSSTRRALYLLIPLAAVGLTSILLMDRFGLLNALLGEQSWNLASGIVVVVVVSEAILLIEKPIQIGLLAIHEVKTVVIGKAVTGALLTAGVAIGLFVGGTPRSGVIGLAWSSLMASPMWVAIHVKVRRTLSNPTHI